MRKGRISCVCVQFDSESDLELFCNFFLLIAGRKRHREEAEVQAHQPMIVGIGGTKKAPNEADRGLEVEDIGRMNAAPLVGVVGLPAVIDIAGSLNAISRALHLVRHM